MSVSQFGVFIKRKITGREGDLAERKMESLNGSFPLAEYFGDTSGILEFGEVEDGERTLNE